MPLSDYLNSSKVLGSEYIIENLDQIDSPALVVYPELIRYNVKLALSMLNSEGGTVLRPHIKTVKTPQVATILLRHGIDRFKCSTIAEGEMLAMVEAPDVLLAYQPTELKIERLGLLIGKYPGTHFSCLVDNVRTAEWLSQKFINKPLDVFIDLNVGMNRTGVTPANAEHLVTKIKDLKGIRIKGLHAYDGHIRAMDTVQRQKETDDSYLQASQLRDSLKAKYGLDLDLVIGGTPSFPMHSERAGVQCSPGTFVFWDAGYGNSFTDMKFKWAAILITRIISIIDEHTICLDLGSKAVAPDPALPRVVFPEHPEGEVVSQSEEHLVVKVPDSDVYKVGDVWMGVPIHVCPTVNLYEQIHVVERQRWMDNWTVLARKRMISI
ncbi:MAG: D-TA family PLP-dependent enzyme [Saprospiraceae bacterium]|nr:D-TA family PLP-dependent enzyme [Saprospiraceae bacterium]